MKKLTVFLSIAACAAIMVSCCGKKNQKETQEQTCCDKAKQEQCDNERKCHGDKPVCNLTEEQKAECEAFKQKWNDFDNLSVEEQSQLISKKRECIEKRRAEVKEKMEACDAKWANFDNLTIKEQKEFLDNAGCCKKKAECKTESTKECHKK